MNTFHKLRAIREGYGLTIDELAQLSEISRSTICRIESGDKTYKINQETAAAIAEALYEQTLNIFDALELSHIGRPPKTGKALTRSDQSQMASDEVQCGSCFTVTRVTTSGECQNCGRTLDS